MAADCFGLPLFLFVVLAVQFAVWSRCGRGVVAVRRAVLFAVQFAVLVCGKMSCTRRNLFQKCHSELVSESMNAEINSA